MADNKQLRVSDLDFDSIKNNLKSFLRSQSEFSDFDFEGAGISQIINLLAYNTHYNGVLANASFNEVFLDSAIRRSSVVSRAKEMNYTPRSRKAARALVDIRVVNPGSSGNMMTLDKYTQFTSSVGGTSFNFYNIAPVSAISVDGEYNFESVPLFEGRRVQNTFTVTTNATPDDTRFTLLNRDIDTDTLEVVVQNSATDTRITSWKHAKDVTGVNGESHVFYIQQNSDGLYQVYFGDGVLGSKLAAGNLVRVTYLVTNADAANVSSNVAQSFTLIGDVEENSDVFVSTVQNSTGGEVEESIESIKFNAPLAMTRNDRTVTAKDYLSEISERISDVGSVSVYGGEDADPPVYGKVFVSIKPKSGYLVPDTVKDEIVSVLRQNNVVTIIPTFIDPDYTYLSFDIDVRYNAAQTTLTSSGMDSAVQTAVYEFFETYLGKFRNPFYFSKLSRVIDDCNDAIVGNVTKINMQKRFDPTFGRPFFVNTKFGIAVKPKQFFSNVFLFTSAAVQVNAILADEGNGVISVYDYRSNQRIKAGVGTINYDTGAINISNLVINAFFGGEAQLKLNVAPVIEVTNVLPSRNQIIMVDDSTESRPANVLAGVKIKSTPTD